MAKIKLAKISSLAFLVLGLILFITELSHLPGYISDIREDESGALLLLAPLILLPLTVVIGLIVSSIMSLKNTSFTRTRTCLIVCSALTAYYAYYYQDHSYRIWILGTAAYGFAVCLFLPKIINKR